MSHTPGPWNQIVKMEGYTAVGAKTLIARVFSEVFRDAENEAANARLVAAAPDLLAACKVALLDAEDCARDVAGTVNEKLFRMTADTLKAAIAKAEPSLSGLPDEDQR